MNRPGRRTQPMHHLPLRWQGAIALLAASLCWTWFPAGAQTPSDAAAAQAVTTTPAAARLKNSDAAELLHVLQAGMPDRAAPSAASAGTSSRDDPEPAPRVTTLLSTALSYIGVRYRYGGNTPERGFDCSGLVRWVYNRTWGVMLPRRANEIAKVGTEVSKEQLQPGDLVFFNTLRRTFSHVGIYLGDGEFLHAPRRGAKVRVEKLDDAYWTKRWNGARRLDELVPAQPAVAAEQSPPESAQAH